MFPSNYQPTFPRNYFGPVTAFARLPINEQISQQLLDVLQGVSVFHGYQTTLTAQRASRPSPPPAKLLTILYEGEDEEDGNGDGEGGAPIGCVGWKRPYAVLIWSGGTETIPTYDTLLNTARADVEKALQQDTSVAGLARNVIIRKPGKVEDDNEPPAVIVNFDVIYWTRFNDPYSQ